MAPYSIEINRPPEAVFAYLDDETKVIQWLQGLVSVTPITEGGNRVGAKARQTYNENGRTFEMIEETLIYEPNRHVKIKAEGDMFDLTAEYRLSDLGGRTRIDFESDVHFKNIFLRLLSPLMARSFRNRMTADFQRLKALAEAE